MQNLVSKMYRDKVLTADSSYIVEHKITLVAVVKKGCLFSTESGTTQRIEFN